ncbi:MAG: hypothetical protein WC613_00325 [Candidatus Aenigmatarchaeota archaeon]
MNDKKKIDDEKQEQATIKKGRSTAKDYPVVTIQTALEVCEAIQKCGGVADSYELIGKVLNVRGGALNNRITAARRYGLVEKDKLVNTELAIRILKPIEPDEDKKAQREAILSVTLFREILQRFGNSLPADNIFKNILMRSYGIPEAAVVRMISTIRRNFELLNETTGITELPISPDAIPSNSQITTPSLISKKELTESLADTESYIIIKDGKNKYTFIIDEKLDWHVLQYVIDSMKKHIEERGE